MAIIEESIVIDCPAAQVFAYVTDAANLKEWEAANLEAERTSPGPAGIGTTSRGID